MGNRCADHVTPLYPQKLALTSPTGDGRSVGIVRSRTKATEFSLYLCFLHIEVRSKSCPNQNLFRKIPVNIVPVPRAAQLVRTACFAFTQFSLFLFIEDPTALPYESSRAPVPFSYQGAYLNFIAMFMKNESFIRTEKVKITNLTLFSGTQNIDYAMCLKKSVNFFAS